ncbi:MAG TPA: glycosyltransferase [Puia sp.]|jgi:glycosyltransferase involved in cell wall biosynthesis|nr:glycosyltransferase [Puia sp.]
MRILFIHNRYQHEGGEDVALDLEVRLLQLKGHVVDTLLFDNEGMDGWMKKIERGLQALYNRRSARIVERAIRDFRPDLIHVHNIFFTASPSVIRVAAKHNVPVVVTLHNYRLICANALLLRDNQVCSLCVRKVFPLAGIRYKCYRGSAAETGLVTAVTGLHKVLRTWQKKVDAYITLTDFARSRFRASSMAGIQDRLRLLPNFIFDPGMGNPAGERKDFFLFVGRLSREKGAHILVEAFAGLPQSKLVIIGDGPERERLQAACGSSGNIIFAGKKTRAEVLQYMKECKALLFPSIWYEGLPFTIIEAFAVGAPVFASAIGAMQELIRDGYNGFHFPAGDAEALRKKIAAFEAQPEANGLLYENARETWLNNFDPESHYTGLMAIYESVLIHKPLTSHA